MDKSYYEYYCDNLEKVENYEAAKKDDFKGWNCHHRLETHTSDGERRLVDITARELMALDMYWHRPASELIFMTTLEHRRLHSKGKKVPAISAANKGHQCSDETKAKISAAMKGKKMPARSEEYKRKMSEAKKAYWARRRKTSLVLTTKGEKK